MSSFLAEPTRSDDEQLNSAPINHGVTEGQRHDRIPGGNPPSVGNSASGGASTEDIQVSAGQRMVSATTGSVLTSVLVTPLDVVRVRLQSQNNPSNSSKPSNISSQFSKLPPNIGVTACCREVFWVGNNAQFCVANGSASTLNPPSSATTLASDCAVEEVQRRTFTSTFDGMKKIARNDGISSLWRGLSPTLIMAIPANVIYFTGYDYLRYHRRSPINRLTNDTYAPLIAGSVARVLAAAVISPIEMFRTRMQAASGSGAGLIKTTFTGLHQLTQAKGYRSLWRGLTLTMWRDVPFSGIYWWGYEAGRNYLADMRDRRQGIPLDSDPHNTRLSYRSHSRDHESHTATFVDSFLAGAASGAVASLVTTPFDVGKTRQQVYQDTLDEVAVQSRLSPSGQNTASTMTIPNAKNAYLRPEQQSMPKFLYHIFKTEGMSGLFTGWAARCMKVAPACAIMISSYEMGKKMAVGINERREGKENS